MTLNRASLIGNVGRDPEIRNLEGGGQVCNLSLATTEKWTDKNTGEKREKTEWHRIVIWGNLVNIVEKYVGKGSQLFIEGKLETRKWTDQQGVEKYTTEIVLRGFDSTLKMLGKKGDGQSQGQQATPQRQAAKVDVPDDDDDDAPF